MYVVLIIKILFVQMFKNSVTGFYLYKIVKLTLAAWNGELILN